MDGGSRKAQARCNISSETGLRRESVGFTANYRVIDSEAWRCLDPTGIPARVWYMTPLWIKLDIEPPIVSFRLILYKSGEGCRCRDGISMPMYRRFE